MDRLCGCIYSIAPPGGRAGLLPFVPTAPPGLTTMTDAPPPQANRLIALATRLGVAALMIAAAAVVFFVLRSTKPQIQHTNPAAHKTTVIVFEAQPVPVQRQWRGYGTAEALDTADVPARVTAAVKSIPKNILPGTRVELGELLVQLDSDDFTRQLEIAQQKIKEIDAAIAQLDIEQNRLNERLALEDSDVAIAQTEYDRQLRFQKRDVATQQDVDASQRFLITAKRSQLQTRESLDLIGPRRRSLQAQKASQQSQVNLTELSEQRTTITSPIRGVIQSIDIEVGENITAGQRIARVVSLSRIEVPIQLPAASRRSIAPGDRLVLRPTSPLPGVSELLTWPTTIARIAPEQDTATRTLTVFAELTQGDDEARLPAPGMFIQATVWVAKSQPRLIVPRRAIRKGRIQIIRNGVLVSQPVKIDFTLSGTQPSFGLPDDQWAVLDAGVTAGDLVVVNAATQLADGSSVNPKLAQPLGTPEPKTTLGTPPNSASNTSGATP